MSRLGDWPNGVRAIAQRIRPQLTPLRLVLGTLLAGWVVFGVVIWVWIIQSGMISVAIESDAIPGGHVTVSVPGAITWAVLPLVPDHVWRECAAEAEDWLPATRALIDELAEAPDFVLVSVSTPDERVFVAKRGRHLYLEVEDPSAEIQCQVPLGAVKVALTRLKLSGLGCRSRTL
jgi:hypothetical protein